VNSALGILIRGCKKTDGYQGAGQINAAVGAAECQAVAVSIGAPTVQRLTRHE